MHPNEEDVSRLLLQIAKTWEIGAPEGMQASHVQMCHNQGPSFMQTSEGTRRQLE